MTFSCGKSGVIATPFCRSTTAVIGCLFSLAGTASALISETVRSKSLREVAEGGGFLARDAALREQAKHLGESTVHAGGGGEIAAGGIEFGKIECGADDSASGGRIAKQLVFSLGVKATQRGMNVGAGHGALASVGEHELAALGQRIGFWREVKSVVVAVGVRLGSVARGRNVVGV